MYYLYNLMGWSCFVGMTVILVSMPLNSVINKQYTKVQERLMVARDKRVTLMNEVNLANKVNRIRKAFGLIAAFVTVSSSHSNAKIFCGMYKIYQIEYPCMLDEY
jgi:hypothetical protein